MAKLKDKRREKVSVATEIDRLEERRARCQDNLERAEFKSRKEKMSEKDRQGAGNVKRREPEEHDAVGRPAGCQRSLLLHIFLQRRRLMIASRILKGHTSLKRATSSGQCCYEVKYT
uniref:Uncharacterized protein n=1 Tax=Amphiprion ocellaris TaxID=80972 RepID=A0AAQ5X2B1_AMPOC